MIILGSIFDRCRKLVSGEKKYTGQVLAFDGGKKTVIATVYGQTLEQMRARKRAVCKALKDLETKDDS